MRQRCSENAKAPTGALHPLVVIRVDADLLLLGAERVLAHLQVLELVVGLEVRPAPHATVDDVRQAFPVGDLQPAVQRTWNGHALAVLPGAAQRLLQVLHGALLLLQLLHQRVHRLLGPLLLLVALLPAEQALHRGAREGEEAGHGGHAWCLGVGEREVLDGGGSTLQGDGVEVPR